MPKILRLPRYLSGVEHACNTGAAGDVGSILGLEDPLENKMATHSSILVWKIPWMEEPGRLQSMGSQSWTPLSDFTFFQRLSKYTTEILRKHENYCYITNIYSHINILVTKILNISSNDSMMLFLF